MAKRITRFFAWDLHKYIFQLALLFILSPTVLLAQTVTKVYDTAGTYMFVAPPCVTSIQVQTWGGGGGGGGSVSNIANDAGGGGGGGAYNFAASMSVIPGSSYPVVVGSGGTAAVSTPGGNGGFSSFNGLVVANGGAGGAYWNVFYSAGNGAGGAGGTGGLYDGGAGARGDHPNSGGGGGGGASSGGVGGTAGTPTYGTPGAGAAGSPPGGSGGAGSNNSTGINGTAPGGGGGGASTSNFITGVAQSGGMGAPGQVIITYTLGPPAITSVTGSGCAGSTITINGTNLASASAVTIGAIAVNNLSITSTVITGTVAAGTTTGLVSVTTPCGTATSSTSFTVYPAIAPVNLGTQNLCGGSTYNLGGHIYSTAGTYADTVPSSVTGCDSIIRITLTTGSVITKSINQSICSGGSYNFGGQNYTTAGVYSDTAKASSGCDSITTLTLALSTAITKSISQTICNGGSYSFGTHTYNAAGVYADTAISTTTGCDSITTLTLSVTPIITRLISQTICSGSNYSFGGNSYNSSGTYADTTTSTVSGCDSITTLTLTVTPFLYHAVVHSICSGNSFNFDGHSYNASGTYADTLIGAGTNGCDSISALILTVSSFATSTSNGSICQGSVYAFNGQNYTTAGTYADTLAGAAVGGCDSIATLVLTIFPAGSVASVNANPLVFCSGDSSQICATAGFASYAWNTGDSSSCFYTTFAGTYIVTVTDVNGCSITSSPATVTTYTPTPVTISVNGDTLTSYGAVSYQWYLNGQPIPLATGSSYLAQQSGDYLVEITDVHGCHYSSSATSVTTGIRNVPVGEQLRVYPNPLSSGALNLDVDASMVGSNCTIFDANGRIVYKSEINSRHSDLELNLANGVYTMQILSDQFKYTLKLIRL